MNFSRTRTCYTTYMACVLVEFDSIFLMFEESGKMMLRQVAVETRKVDVKTPTIINALIKKRLMPENVA